MGAESFIKFVDATSAKEGFDMLVGAEREYYGSNPYNGSIYHCSMGKLVKSYKKYSEKVLSEVYKEIEKRGNGKKYCADYIDCGVVEYRIVKVNKQTFQKNPTFKMRYIVYRGFQNLYIKEFSTKKEADTFAKNYSMKNAVPAYVKKEYRMVSGDNVVSKFTVNVKKQKNKPTNTKGVVKIHRYCFFGFAPV